MKAETRRGDRSTPPVWCLCSESLSLSLSPHTTAFSPFTCTSIELRRAPQSSAELLRAPQSVLRTTYNKFKQHYAKLPHIPAYFSIISHNLASFFITSHDLAEFLGRFGPDSDSSPKTERGCLLRRGAAGKRRPPNSPSKCGRRLLGRGGR